MSLFTVNIVVKGVNGDEHFLRECYVTVSSKEKTYECYIHYSIEDLSFEELTHIFPELKHHPSDKIYWFHTFVSESNQIVGRVIDREELRRPN